MDKHITNFETAEEFASVSANTNIIERPHVSLTKDDEEVHYLRKIKPILTVKYNIAQTGSTKLLSGQSASSGFSSMEVDGTELQSVITAYTFDTVGEHTVKYTLENPTEIGGDFYRITSITEVIIPECVTTIGNLAFSGCTSLTSINIPDSVISINTSAFYKCSAATSCTIGSSVTSIGSSAFEGCSGLTSIVIPNSVTSIGYHAFNYCTGITSCTLGSSVASIGEQAFAFCSFTSITIPSSVTSISLAAFSANYNLRVITVDSMNTVYDSRDNCNAIIKTSTNELIQSCVTTTIPNSVTSIGENAFAVAIWLTNVNISNNITNIGTYAFYSCTAMTSVSIGSGVTTIGSGAFYNCNNLTSITFYGTTPPTLGSLALYETNECPIYVPSASVAAYKSASGWSNYATRIQGI